MPRAGVHLGAQLDGGQPRGAEHLEVAVQGPTVGSGVLSPGRSLLLSYALPPGTFVLACFVADDVTGMPHAMMGMHRVVVVR